MTLKEMYEEMYDYGYIQHFNVDDAGIVEEDPCPVCKGPMEYRGFKKDESYRAFAVCKKMRSG